MGCGASSSTESVAEAAVAVGSSRPTTINNDQNSAGSTRGYTARNQQTIAISGGGQPVGKRLTLPAPYRHGKPITQREIERLREEFWNTRVEGNSIMWQTLHSAADAILMKDLDLANAILEASNIVTPQASLDLCYDERGYGYNVPSYCFSVPLDLVSAPAQSGSTVKKDPLTKSNTGTQLKIKLRINPGDFNIVLDSMSSNSIADLKKQIYDYSNDSNGKMPLCEESLQRVMFMGKELQNSMSLKQAGVDEVRIVQVFIRPKKQ